MMFSPIRVARTFAERCKMGQDKSMAYGVDTQHIDILADSIIQVHARTANL